MGLHAMLSALFLLLAAEGLPAPRGLEGAPAPPAAPLIADEPATCDPAVELSATSGTITAIGGFAFTAKGIEYYHNCVWVIRPNVRVSSITFHLDLGKTYFHGTDRLSFYSDTELVEFHFSAQSPLFQTMTLMNSRSVTIVLLSSSPLTRFKLHFECVESDEIEIFGLFFPPERFAVIITFATLFILLLFVVIPSVWCWYRREAAIHQWSFERSVVMAHADYQRQRRAAAAAAAEEERHVLSELQAIPVASAKEAQGTDGHDCCLCLESFGSDDELRILPCGHFFHKDCVDKWFAARRFRPRSCPTCRRNPVTSTSTRSENSQPPVSSNLTSAASLGTSGDMTSNPIIPMVVPAAPEERAPNAASSPRLETVRNLASDSVAPMTVLTAAEESAHLDTEVGASSDASIHCVVNPPSPTPNTEAASAAEASTIGKSHVLI